MSRDANYYDQKLEALSQQQKTTIEQCGPRPDFDHANAYIQKTYFHAFNFLILAIVCIASIVLIKTKCTYKYNRRE